MVLSDKSGFWIRLLRDRRAASDPLSTDKGRREETMSKLENVGGMPADFAGFGDADELSAFGAPGDTRATAVLNPQAPMQTSRDYETGDVGEGWTSGLGDSSMRGANISTAAEHNRKIILHALRSGRDLTSPDLADLVGLSPPAVFRIVRKLSEEGWIVRSRADVKSRGQPTHKLNINPNAAFALGLHIDAEHLTLVAVDFAGKLRHRIQAATPFAGPAQVRFFVASAISELRARTFGAGARITGLGLALPEELASLPLRAHTSWHKRWGAKDPAEVLQSIVEARVVLDTEGASAATGEMLSGVGMEVPSFFYVLVGDTLSGGLVINNRYVRGARGRGAEIGLFPQISADREPQEISTAAMLLPALLKDLSDLGYTGPDLEFLAHLDTAGQAVLDSWLDRIAGSLYFPLFAMVCAVDPNAIVIGGPLPESVISRLCLKIRERFTANVGVYWQQMIVKPAMVGSDPAAVGAALQAFPEIWAPNVQWVAPLKAIQG